MNSEMVKKYTFITKKLNILIVEDDDHALKTLQKTFSKFFQTVFVAQDGKVALDIFTNGNNKIDIILTDVVMPNMDGVNLAKAVRQTNINIPLIIISAYSDINNFAQLLNLNIEAFLPKPVGLDILLLHIYKAAVKIDDYKMVERYQSTLEKQLFHAKKRILKLEQDLNVHNNNQDTVQKPKNIDKDKNLQYQTQETTKNINPIYEDTDYFEILTIYDKQDIADAVDDMINHVLLIRDEHGIIEKARLLQALSDLRRFINHLKKCKTFDRLAISLQELHDTLLSSITTIVQEHDRLILKLLEELSYTLEQFIIDIIKIKSENPNYFDDSIIADIESVLIATRAKHVDISEIHDCELF